MARANLSPLIKAQVEKLIAASSGRRSITSSSPIIIPRKPPRSNASSHSSSSYTSVVDQISSFGELDDVSNTTFPTLPCIAQQLEHSAARDRISVKNKRRQPIKQKLSTLRENDDNESDLFSLKPEAISSPPEEDQAIPTVTRIESKVQQPLIDLADLDSTRARLRMSVRSRDRSADNILLATHTHTDLPANPPVIIPKFPSPMQRSVSFKRPQEIKKGELVSRMISKSKTEENQSIYNDPSSTQSISCSSSQEHIYDNLDVFKRSKPNDDDESSSKTPIVKTREHPIPSLRLRPITMHGPTDDDKQTTNEFENVFNQLKKRGSIRRIRPTEEPAASPSPPSPEATPIPPQPEAGPIIKPPETTPSPIPRRTIVGVHLPTSNKVASDDQKPTPSWIDIAKQKQTKLQSVSNETNQPDEGEEQPLVAVRKQSSSVDIRSNRKSMFEQSNNSSAIERDSIRAFKAGNPNRINNLIQFFDK